MKKLIYTLLFFTLSGCHDENCIFECSCYTLPTKQTVVNWNYTTTFMRHDIKLKAMEACDYICANKN